MLEQRLSAVWGRGRPGVMGILNITPDSFSDGGAFLARQAAIARGLALLAAGADVIDVGGESTRPGAELVEIGEELRRVVPVVSELARMRPEALISVDTSKAQVAAAALASGARLINDVTAGRDPGLFETVREHAAGVVLMHMRGEPRTMQLDTAYHDVVAEVHEYLAARATAARAAGIPNERIFLDPGIGFGKDVQGNLRLLAALEDLAALGHAVVVGSSRKAFIGTLTGAKVDGRLAGTLASLTDTVGLPRVLVRVHDVAPVVQFLSVLAALRGAA